MEKEERCAKETCDAPSSLGKEDQSLKGAVTCKLQAGRGKKWKGEKMREIVEKNEREICKQPRWGRTKQQAAVRV